MDLNTLMFLTLLGMISAIILGVHIAIALGLTALIGTFIIFGSLDLATFMLGAAAYDALRDELFATIPLFVLMGDFVAKSGAARDLYKPVNRGLARIPGRLAVATVIGNTADDE
ncbi:MAG: TRAP transporter large permease subunit, partial [Chloroflexi bacterium]|nr:TRAP transporter large permease subunit [Chloroflexota bacterium]